MRDFNIKYPARKVPEIIAIFWLIKLLTTAMGEVTSDYLVHVLNPFTAVGIGAIGFLIAIILQFSVKRYIPWVYWLAVTMVAIFGTMAADVLHIGLGIPYIVSTTLFALSLTIIFGVWHKTEKTLSIHSINTRRRELFYWAAVIATFALGTAVGDMTAVTFSLGYFASGVLFGLLMLIPAVGYLKFKLNPVIAFWFAYVLTRPLGASFADWAGKPQELGGLGIGTGVVSVVLGTAIIISVAYISYTKKDQKRA